MVQSAEHDDFDDDDDEDLSFILLYFKLNNLVNLLLLPDCLWYGYAKIWNVQYVSNVT